MATVSDLTDQALPSYRLRLHLAAGYTLLVIYASLHPLTGWRDSGAVLLDFLWGAWPRYFTAFDLVTNVLAYSPFGFLWFAALRRWLTRPFALLLAFMLGGGLSFAMETIQNYLPSRVPSNVDMGCNMLGALIGAAIGVRWEAFFDEKAITAWRNRFIVRGQGVEFGLLLVVAWLLTQLSPETLLFGNGNLRQLLDFPPAQPFNPERFVGVETIISASGMLAAGLIGQLLLKYGRWRQTLVMILMFFLLVGGLRSLAYAFLMEPSAAFSWLTTGNATGMAIGALLWLAASWLTLPLRRAVAALSLLLVTVMVNLAPENPYLANTLLVWNPGHFLNFNGLTGLVCWLWPFVTLPWLMVFRPDANI